MRNMEQESGEASLPVRGAWIEMLLNNVLSDKSYVAPRAGSVD